MDKLLDLDKLHRQQARQRVRNILITSLTIIAVLVIGVVALSNKKPAEHLATVSEFAPQSSTITPSTATTSPTSPANALSQEEAADKAAAAQDETSAEQVVKNAQASNQSMASAAATCAQNQQALTQANQLTTQLDQLALSEEAESKQEALGPTSGQTVAQFLAYYNNLNQQNSAQTASLQQQINAAQAEVGGC